MKKVTLLLMVCCMSFMAFAEDWTITYELNGGVTNDYGWQNKADMLVGLNQDYNVFYNVPETFIYYTWEPLDTILTKYTDAVLRIAIYTDAAPSIGRGAGLMHGLLMTEKWEWLHDYIVATVADQGIAAIAEDESAHAYWRYNTSAFFVSGKRATWPASADYAVAGQPDAFIPAWKHAFTGPNSYDGTEEIILPIPYKEGESFAGWFDNAACTGSRITSIPEGAIGDKTFYAKYGEYIPPCKEVWEMAEGTTTKTSGIVTFVAGTTAYIQDASAGLLVEFAEAPDIARGDEIIIEGTTAAVGTYVKLTGAELAGDPEAAALPTAPKVLLTALATNIFKYVAIEGLRITEYAGGNAILSDGAATVTLAAALDQAEFPVKTKVNIKAVVGYTDAIILVGVASDVEKAPLAGVDPFEYPSIGEDGKYTLTNKWLFSNVLDNFSANRPGIVEYVRGMVAKDGKMYFVDRNLKQLTVVDSATGEMLDPIKLAADIFTYEGEVAGQNPFNDIKIDAAGNILLGNCIVSNAQVFQIWKIDLATGNGTLILQEILKDNPDYADATIRFDAFGIYGNVDGNGIIMACNASAMEAYKWTIKNGVVGTAEVVIIDNSEEGTFLTGLANPGTAPQIFPMDEDYFYIDGWSTLPTLIDMEGNVVDGFFNVPVEVEDWSVGYANKAGHNGLIEFELGGEYFFLMAFTNTVGASPYPASTFRLLKFKDANKEFKDIETLWVLPEAGMGGASNSYRTAVPSVEIDEAAKTATLYLYTGENGYGAYEFKINVKNSMDVVNNDAIGVFVSGNEVQLSEKAANIKVFNLVGQLAQTAQGVSSVTIAGSGVYIVTVQTLQGETVVKKVIIK